MRITPRKCRLSQTFEDIARGISIGNVYIKNSLIRNSQVIEGTILNSVISDSILTAVSSDYSYIQDSYSKDLYSSFSIVYNAVRATLKAIPAMCYADVFRTKHITTQVPFGTNAKDWDKIPYPGNTHSFEDLRALPNDIEINIQSKRTAVKEIGLVANSASSGIKLKEANQALLFEAQRLLGFLSKTRLEKEAEPISVNDLGRFNPIILVLGSPAPKAFKKAALDWLGYRQHGLGNIPVIITTGRGRGYSELVLGTLRFLEEEDAKNNTDFALKFEWEYASEIEKVRITKVEDLRIQYLQALKDGKLDSRVLTEAKVVAFILRMYGVDTAAMILEERSTDTYHNISESLKIIEHLEERYRVSGNDLELKIRIVAAGFHRLRALMVTIGLLNEGTKHRAFLEATNNMEYLRDLNIRDSSWQFNAEDSENMNLSELPEDLLYEYLIHMIGNFSTQVDIRGEIERLTEVSGAWLIHSSRVKAAIESYWGTPIATELRKRLIRDYKGEFNSSSPVNEKIVQGFIRPNTFEEARKINSNWRDFVEEIVNVSVSEDKGRRYDNIVCTFKIGIDKLSEIILEVDSTRISIGTCGSLKTYITGYGVGSWSVIRAFIIAYCYARKQGLNPGIMRGYVTWEPNDWYNLDTDPGYRESKIGHVEHLFHSLGFIDSGDGWSRNYDKFISDMRIFLHGDERAFLKSIGLDYYSSLSGKVTVSTEKALKEVSSPLIKGAIFDFDGVIGDTLSLHFEAWKRALEEGGIKQFDIQLFNKYVSGRNPGEAIRDLLQNGILPEKSEGEINAIRAKRRVYYSELISQKTSMPFYATTVSLMKELRQSEILVAIGSANDQARKLSESALGRYINAIATGDEVAYGKPAPDIFILAANKIGVKPEEAIVFEDAVSGAQAGRSGNFGLVVGIDRGNNREELLKAGADVVVSDLGDISIAKLSELFLLKRKAVLPGYLLQTYITQNLTINRLTDITSGTSFEVMPQRGATIISFKVGCTEALFCPDITKSGGIPVLWPYANRIRGSIFTFQDRQIDLHSVKGTKDDGNGNVYHGMVRLEPWEVEEIGSDTNGAFIKLSLDTEDYPLVEQYFAKSKITLTYALKANQLTIETVIQNLDSKDLIMSLAFHPWFNTPDKQNWQITLPASSYWQAEKQLPSGVLIPVEGTNFDLRVLQTIGARTYDDVLTNLEFKDAKATSLLKN
ncbi:MAG: HAD-IA family hydrolase, partial [Candidatus Omnitrophota bacterium]